MSIHPAAIVDAAAKVDESAEIGPYCVLGADVVIGARTRLMAHVFVEGPRRSATTIFSFPTPPSASPRRI